MGFAPVVVDLSRGLVGWWKFDEGAGTTARDSSPGGSHVQLREGARWTDGKLGAAVRLGQGGISGSLPPRTVGAASVAVWVRHDTLRAGKIERYVTVGPAPLVLRKHGDGTLEFYVRPHGNVKGRSPISEKTWMHVVGTWDGKTACIYVDGRAVADGKVEGDPVSVSVVHIGHGEWLNGSLDDVRVYDRALSAAEVRVLYQAGQ